MKVPKKPLLVYFVDGMRAKPEDVIAAQEYSVGKLRMQNARLVTEVDPDVDGVAGTIPPVYRGHKSAQQALMEYNEALNAIRKASKDSVAPTPTKEPSERVDFETKDEEPSSSVKPVTKQPVVKPKVKS